MKTFDTEQEFAGAVSSSMKSDLAKDLAAAVQDGILEGERTARDSQGEAAGFNVRVGNWVLRDSDVPIIEVISGVASGILAITATGPIGLAAVLTGIKSFAKIAWDAWRKSARLGPNEIALLGLVEVLGPVEEEKLLAEAEKLDADIDSESWVKSILSLTDVELANGDFVELIRKDASGRWVAR